ncbi:hypothetical protein PMAYCL1PPCAC_11142, partial [Pristionchus mayeri]
MNSCLHIRYNITDSKDVNTRFQPNCNEKIPMYNFTKRGKGMCFLKTTETATTTCWGDYCFWDWQDFRGCVDAAGANGNFQLRLGESSLDNLYFVICKGNYCNSDYQYPNGTIVGPSAARRFTPTNLQSSISMASLILLIL